jgi:hypothetical protein
MKEEHRKVRERGHLPLAGKIRSESKQLAVPSSWRGRGKSEELQKMGSHLNFPNAEGRQERNGCHLAP